MSVVAGKNQGPGNSKKPKPYQQHAILGFIQAILMPIRRSKKLNLLLAFSNLISTILFQSIMALNLHSKQINLGFFYFKLFICPPDVKRPKSFRYFTPWIPSRTPPWTRWGVYSTSRPWPVFYNIHKLNLCSKNGY